MIHKMDLILTGVELCETTTLGGSGTLCLAGVEEPAWVVPLLGPPLREDGWYMLEFCCAFRPAPGPPGIGAPAWLCVGPSAGRGLFRESTRLEVDDVGVAWAELAGDWPEAPCGDAVPEGLSFFLASLPSLP